ncbi:ABC transporter substrate-binding protein [bacterium]|nr:ABC transporter substrate-binding protein [bacterium]
MRALLIALLVTLGVAAQPKSPVKIGMSAAFRGPSRALGIELYRGAQGYFQEFNARGGLDGHPVELVAKDDGYNPAPAILNTIELVKKEKVSLLFGYVGTPTVTRVLPLLKGGFDQPQVLMFPFTGAQPQRQPPYADICFNLRASYREETAGLIDHLYTLGYRKTGIFYQCDAYGRSGWEGVRRALHARDLGLCAEATYRRGSSFDQSYLQQVRILRQAGVDHVICVGSYAACAGFIRDARDQQWEIPIANVSFVGSESMLDLLTKASRKQGQDYTRRLINSQVVPSYNDSRLPAVLEYCRCMNNNPPMPPPKLVGDGPGYRPLPYSFVSFEGYLCAKLMCEMLRRAGPPWDSRRVVKAAESMQNFDLGIESPVSFSQQRHQGLHKVYFTTVARDQFVPLEDWSGLHP